MGAGHFGAGVGRAGFDDTTYSAEVVRVRPAARLFDPVTRDYVLDSDGLYEGIHPVDAAVQQAMHFVAKRLTSAPDAGNTLREIKSAFEPRVRSNVENRVRAALAHLVARRDITIDSIEFEPGGKYGLKVGLAYWNERLLPRSRQTTNTG